MNQKSQMPISSKNLFSLFSGFPGFMEDFEASLPAKHSSVSISEDEKNVYVEAHMPGLNESEIEISLDKGVLWIKGERKEEEQDKKRKYYYKCDRSYSYRVAVPGEIDANKEPEAHYEKGILNVAFLKSAKEQPKRISVRRS